jgi:hypothetical protein
MAIDTTADLRAHVALACQVELSTIPPYLYAMYSIRDQESDAARLIASVVVEEMLHVCLATNLLLALGGEPNFGLEVMPSYPANLAHHKPDLLLELKACTPELVTDCFMAIERPSAAGALPEDDDFETLGQFYGALKQALDDLGDKSDLFANCQSDRQLSDPAFYGPVKFDAADSGGLLLVHDRASADRALEIIVDQGEGLSDHKWADPDHQELTHYYKFAQIADGTTPIGEVWPVTADPRTNQFPEAVRPVSDLFNALYRLVYVTMQDLFSGAGSQSAYVDRLYELMSDCLAPTARYLVSYPIGDEATASPTFEPYPLGEDPWEEVAALAESVIASHPELAGVMSTVSRAL